MRRLAHLALRRLPGPLGDQRGVALVLTLLVVVLLTAMILDFDFRTRLDLRAAGNFRDDTRAYLLASSAVEAARALLQDDLGQSGHDSLDELWATPLVGIPVADGTVSVTVVDETGKLDLNMLLNAAGKPDETRREVYRRLLEQLLEDVEQADVDVLVDAVIDWIDADDESGIHGAESADYETLDPPYSARNGKLRSFDELALVKGYTPEVMEIISPHVTAIWAGDAATNKASGAARHDRVNINTASTEVLVALHPEMSETLAGHIIDDRPFESIRLPDLDAVIGLGPEIPQKLVPLLTVRSDYFSVTAQGVVGDTVRSVRATVRRRPGGASRRQTQVIAWRVE